jgi:chromosomal replication initiation ATPase DnaA
MISARDLAGADGLLERGGPGMAGRDICVEDIDLGLGDAGREEALFHLLNMAREKGSHVLLTSHIEPGTLNLGLADLRSRLLALPLVAIGEPDDDLLMAVMVKLFADRQIEIEPGLVSYILRRMERSFLALAQIVDALDRASLSRRRRIGKALAREVLAELAASAMDGEKAERGHE